MNCALEDCWVLMRSVERMAGEWPRVFADFEQNRHLDADAITFLSEANYDEMSRQVTQREFKRRREIEQALQIRFPQSFVPLYALIAFSTVPYAQALARGTTQAAIVDHLLDALNRIEDLDLETEWLKNALDAASSSGERSSDEFSPASDQGCEMTKMQG
jgi:kynurenine 3-monooxygenase